MANRTSVKCNVDITGIHKHDGLEAEETKTSTKCVMYIEDGKYTLEYEEYMDGNGPESFKGGIATYNNITITDSEMTIIRKGSIESGLYFKEGNEDISDYKTLYGIMKTKVNTKKYNMYLMEKGKRLIAEAQYDISVNGMSMSEAMIRVDISII